MLDLPLEEVFHEPPADVVPNIVYHHFSKSDVGRYGFFPRAEGTE